MHKIERKFIFFLSTIKMDHQSWEPIVLSKKNTTDRKLQDKQTSQRGETEGKLEAPSNLGQLIAGGRTIKQMTQKLLANRLGIAPTVLSRVESGKEVPTNAMIAKIERILGIKLPRVKKVAYTE
jgi:ribosome-binding protein aMBF1 (putative translation factor)